MNSQSELLKTMIASAKKRNYSIRETQSSFDFYKDNILVDRFLKFNTDYTMSEAEFKRRLDYIEKF